MRVDVGISEDVPVAEQQAIAVRVEQAGFGGLWTNESRGRDALQICQAWALATRQLQVGTGVVPLWTRSAAQLAMSAATVQEASDGRLLLGIGVSHAATQEPWHGVEYHRPLTAARETLAILDSLLSGGTAGVDGRVRSSERLRLAITPRPRRPPLYLAAMGPQMLALAGSAADGVLLNWSTPDAVAGAVRATRDAAGGRAETPEVAAYVRVAVDPDRSAARRALARELGRYCALPAYAEHLTRQGLGDTVEALKAAHRRDETQAGAVDDEVLLRLGWYGTPGEDPRRVLDGYAAAGLDRLVARVVPVGGHPGASVEAALRALPTAVGAREG